MMLTPNIIRTQIEKLTADFIELSLCNQQNFPSLRKERNNLQEIGISGCETLGTTLKNITYHELYVELDRTQAFNIKMLDGALIQIVYSFQNNQLKKHRLAFFPSPFLEEFQNNPDIYLDDEIYADIIMKNIVPFPVRFDFDCDESVVVDVEHPQSHLTLGQYKNCRIPVSAPITPYHFGIFILKNFYNTAYHKYCNKITKFHQAFASTITNDERKTIHVNIPPG